MNEISHKTTKLSCTSTSVLDTKDTKSHFSQESNQSNTTPATFQKSYFRIKNLQLADSLLTSSYRDHPTIHKMISYLRFCQSLTILETTTDNIHKTLHTSKRCKYALCHICARAKSVKLGRRLRLLLDHHYKNYPDDQLNHYFLTLTLRHSDSIRNEVYLHELKAYITKLFRKKCFTSNFKPTSEHNSLGTIQTFECTISKDSLHIHSHVLISCARLKVPVSLVEDQIRTEWLKMTKDSSQIRLDLVYNKNSTRSNVLTESVTTIDASVISELFKYTVKTSNYSNLSLKQKNLLAQWIINSKNVNMVNCAGLFRGHQLTSRKCPLDSELPLIKYDLLHTYTAVRTSSLKYNVSLIENYSSSHRKIIEQKIRLLGLPLDSLDITDYIESYLEHQSLGFDESDVMRIIKTDYEDRIKDQAYEDYLNYVRSTKL